MLNDPRLTFTAVGQQCLQALLECGAIKDAKERVAVEETRLLQWLRVNVLVDATSQKLTVPVMKGALRKLRLRLGGNREILQEQLLYARDQQTAAQPRGQPTEVTVKRWQGGGMYKMRSHTRRMMQPRWL